MELPLPALGAAEALVADETGKTIVALLAGRGATSISISQSPASPAFYPSASRARFCDGPAGRLLILATPQLGFVTLSAVDVDSGLPLDLQIDVPPSLADSCAKLIRNPDFARRPQLPLASPLTFDLATAGPFVAMLDLAWVAVWRTKKVASGIALHMRIHVPLNSPPLALGVTPNFVFVAHASSLRAVSLERGRGKHKQRPEANPTPPSTVLALRTAAPNVYIKSVVSVDEDSVIALDYLGQLHFVNYSTHRKQWTVLRVVHACKVAQLALVSPVARDATDGVLVLVPDTCTSLLVSSFSTVLHYLAAEAVAFVPLTGDVPVVTADVELEITKSLISPLPILALACLPPSLLVISTASGVRMLALAGTEA